MAVHNMRATQKIIKMNPNKDKGLEKIELRIKAIEQSINLILQKLDNNDQGEVEQEKQLELPNFKYPTL